MQGSQIYTPPLTKVNRYILIAMASVFLINTIMSQAMGLSLIPYLSLNLGGLKSGFINQLVTFPFIEANFMSLIFEGLLLWFIGSELETKWGKKLYIEFFVVSILTSGPFYLILGSLIPSFAHYPLMGITSFTYALLMAYAMIYSDRHLTFMLLFPMKAKYFCMLLAGIQLYMGLTSGAGATSLSHVFAMLGAYIFLKYKSLKAQGVSVSSIKQQMHKQQMKNKLHIVRDDAPSKPDPKDPKFWQ